MIEPPTSNDTPSFTEVKEITINDTLTKRTFQIQLQGHMLLALEEYARENNISNKAAFKQLLEFRLFQLGKLPEWWYTRDTLGGIL